MERPFEEVFNSSELIAESHLKGVSLFGHDMVLVEAGVATLAFSRNAENESDEYSVKYLYPSAYDARGVGGFFQKIDASNYPPTFLSTHPHPDNRYQNIEQVWTDLGAKEGLLFEDSYAAVKSSLP